MSFVSLNIEYFPDPTRGVPVYKGYVYVGEPNTDPEVPGNQKTVTLLKSDGTEVATAQPLRTGAGGVVLYDNSPVQVLVEGSYSLKVLDKRGSQVYYLAEGAGIKVPGTSLILSILKDVVGMSDGELLSTSGRATPEDQGGGVWVFDSDDLSASVTNDPSSGIYAAPSSDPTGASGAWVRQYNGEVFVEWFGAVADGVTDNYSAIKAAVAYINLVNGALLFSEGTYYVSMVILADGGVDTAFSVGSNTVIRGQGKDLTIITTDDAEWRDHLFSWSGVSNCEFSDIALVCTTGDLVGFKIFNSSSYITIERVSFTRVRLSSESSSFLYYRLLDFFDEPNQPFSHWYNSKMSVSDITMTRCGGTDNTGVENRAFVFDSCRESVLERFTLVDCYSIGKIVGEEYDCYDFVFRDLKASIIVNPNQGPGLPHGLLFSGEDPSGFYNNIIENIYIDFGNVLMSRNVEIVSSGTAGYSNNNTVSNITVTNITLSGSIGPFVFSRIENNVISNLKVKNFTNPLDRVVLRIETGCTYLKVTDSNLGPDQVFLAESPNTSLINCVFGFLDVSSNSDDVMVKDCEITGSTYGDSIQVRDSLRVLIDNVHIHDMPGRHIKFNANADYGVVSNCKLIKAVGQAILFNNGLNIAVINNYIEGGASTTYGVFTEGTWKVLNNFFSGTFSSSPVRGDAGLIKDNTGFISEASGIATMLSGTATLIITHGLAYTPTRVQLTGTNGEVSNAVVTTISATTFTITIPSTTSANRDIYWEAKRVN